MRSYEPDEIEERVRRMQRYENRRFDASARQEFLTPGVEDVLALIDQHCRPREMLLEVAFGKGEASCRLAERYGSRVVGVDLMDMMCRRASTKVRARLLSAKVRIVRGDGRFLPLLEASFDGAYCTGSPQIAGGADCLREMYRTLKPGGWVAVSDWVWRAKPVPPEVVPQSVRVEHFKLLDEYAADLRAAGFEVVLAQMLPPYVWDHYYGPRLEAVADVLRAHAGDPEAKRWAESHYANEPRLWYETEARRWWGYAAFIARKRE